MSDPGFTTPLSKGFKPGVNCHSHRLLSFIRQCRAAQSRMYGLESKQFMQTREAIKAVLAHCKLVFNHHQEAEIRREQATPWLRRERSLGIHALIQCEILRK